MVKKIGPYRVEQRLGVGGMGEVYKAYDDRLDRWVAIKRIRPDKEGADDNRERFQREARATAKLNHSSIVHLYDIFQDGDSDCIVMEYVEGRTLDTLVMEGPLEPSLTMRLGLEIASGLAEAHAKGIIHRDLKVENIILTPEEHAKILDFGLAKPILSNELDTSLTGKGQLVGTSRAMSPEYVSGEEIDHRSDLFSLGVLLYEAATGHSPFKAHNTLATLKQVMLHSQTPACQVHSRVPVELSELIDRLLEKDPEDRPQTSEEVVEAFRHMTSHLSSSSTVARPGGSTAVHPAPPPGSFSASATAIEHLTRRPYLWGLIPLLVVIAGLAAWSFQAPEALVTEDSARRAPDDWNPVVRESIVIADFENKTGEPLLDDTLGFAFRLGLEQSRVAQALSPAQISAALARMEQPEDTPIDRSIGQEIVQREGAKALVIGSIIKIIDSYQLSGTILDPKGATTFARSFGADSPEEIVGALNTLTQAIRTNLGESLGSIRQANSLDKVTTNDLEALRAYSLGVARQADGKFEEATSFFKVALEQDPEFAMAHGKLAAIYIYRRDYEQGLQHIDRALARSDRLTRYEALYLQGQEARLREPPEEVVRIWTNMSSLYPEVQVGHRNAGMAYFFLLNQFEEAASHFAEAARLAGKDNRPDSYDRLGQSQLALGDLDGALESFKRSGSRTSQYWTADYLVVAGEPEEARDLLETLRGASAIDERQFNAIRWTTVETDLGNLESAQTHAREAATLSESRSEESQLATRLAILALAEWESDFEDELATSLEASFAAIEREEQRRLAEALGGLHELPFPMVATIGKISARSGSLDEAIRLLDRIRPLALKRGLPVWNAHVRMLEAEVALAQGKPAAAIQALDNALNLANFAQIHETRARTLTAAGQFSDAAEEYRWMLEHKGRAIVECRSGCQALSVLDWHFALLGLARALEGLQRETEAQERLAEFQSWEPSLQTIGDGQPPPRLRSLL